MYENIAKVTGHNCNPNDGIVNSILQRIARKLPDIDHATDEEILAAEAAVNAEGQLAISMLVKQLTKPKSVEREYKIRRTLKGTRIVDPAPNGIRYSFGPIWNDTVLAGKGAAVSPNCREKLDHQARLAGVKDPEQYDQRVLCELVAQSLRGEKLDAWKALKVLETPAKSPRKAKGNKEPRVAKEGSGGFRMGPKWLASIKEGGELALLPYYSEKLLKTAEVYGVPIIEGEDPASLCQRIAVKL